eukprot:CFRG4389T1
MSEERSAIGLRFAIGFTFGALVYTVINLVVKEYVLPIKQQPIYESFWGQLWKVHSVANEKYGISLKMYKHISKFVMSRENLVAITKAIKRDLSHEDSSLKMLPTFVKSEFKYQHAGKCIGVSLGDRIVQVAIVTFNGSRKCTAARADTSFPNSTDTGHPTTSSIYTYRIPEHVCNGGTFDDLIELLSSCVENALFEFSTEMIDTVQEPGVKRALCHQDSQSNLTPQLSSSHSTQRSQQTFGTHLARNVTRSTTPPSSPLALRKSTVHKHSHGSQTTISGTGQDMKVELPMGVAFAYPISQTSITDGQVLMWAKEFNVTGYKNKNVGAALTTHLKAKGLNVRVVAMVNDVTAKLIASKSVDRQIRCSLLIDDGVNLVYEDNNCNYINTELGGFSCNLDLPLTDYDQSVDETSQNKGNQLYEKEIGSKYQAEIIRCMIVAFSNNARFAKILFLDEEVPSPFLRQGGLTYDEVTQIMSDCSGNLAHTKFILCDRFRTKNPTLRDCLIVKFLCETVSLRAANLMACALAAVYEHLGVQSLPVILAGRVHTLTPGFRSHIMAGLDRLSATYMRAIQLHRDRQPQELIGAGAGCLSGYHTYGSIPQCNRKLRTSRTSLHNHDGMDQYEPSDEEGEHTTMTKTIPGDEAGTFKRSPVARRIDMLKHQGELTILRRESSDGRHSSLQSSDAIKAVDSDLINPNALKGESASLGAAVVAAEVISNPM